VPWARAGPARAPRIITASDIAFVLVEVFIVRISPLNERREQRQSTGRLAPSRRDGGSIWTSRRECYYESQRPTLVRRCHQGWFDRIGIGLVDLRGYRDTIAQRLQNDAAAFCGTREHLQSFGLDLTLGLQAASKNQGRAQRAQPARSSTALVPKRSAVEVRSSASIKKPIVSAHAHATLCFDF